LKRWPKMYQWLGFVIIIAGLCIVGAGDMIYKEEVTETCLDLIPNVTTTMMPTTTMTTTATMMTTTTTMMTTTITGNPAATTTSIPTTTTYHYVPECEKNKLGSNPLVGDIIIVLGEVFHAGQFIYEEIFLTRFDLPPLKVVGFEGIFGFTTIGLLLWPFYFIYTGESFGLGPEYRFEDAIDGFSQLGNSMPILGWTLGNMFSIAAFNFAGVTVTKELNGTTRAVLDNIRQIFIWAFSLIVGWQTFNWMTPVGFVVLIIGIWLYNDVIIRPLTYKYILRKPLPA